jgi:hypothetical protein
METLLSIIISQSLSLLVREKKFILKKKIFFFFNICLDTC